MTTEIFTAKKQQCNVAGLVLSWVGYLAGLIFLALEHRWAGGLAWLVLVPCMRWLLFRFFPSVSRFLGYGRIDDVLPATVKRSRVAVRFYSFFSCPFCPIVWERLEGLQKEMDFTLEKIDVTLKPQLLMSKGIFAVPVVEVGEERLVGNAITEQLAKLIGLAVLAEPLARQRVSA